MPKFEVSYKVVGYASTIVEAALYEDAENILFNDDTLDPYTAPLTNLDVREIDVTDVEELND